MNKNLNYLRISVTDRCNINCTFCMPPGGIKKVSPNKIIKCNEIEKVINIFQKLGFNKIRFTGGEPFARGGFLNFLEKIVPEYPDISFYITTNLSIPSDYIKRLNKIPLAGINIGISSLNDKIYKKITGSDSLKTVLENIDNLSNSNIKINTVVLKNINEYEIENIIYFAHQRNITPRFIECMSSIVLDNTKYYVSNDVIRDRLIKKNYLEQQVINLYNNSTAKYYIYLPTQKPIGFINPISHSFCNTCSRVRLTSFGKIKLCLFQHDELNILNIMRTKKYSDTQLKTVIENHLNNKCIPKKRIIHTGMMNIGG